LFDEAAPKRGFIKQTLFFLLFRKSLRGCSEGNCTCSWLKEIRLTVKKIRLAVPRVASLSLIPAIILENYS